MGSFVPEMTFFDEGSLVAVLTTEPLGRALDYKAPQGGCFLGAFVEVPLGPRRVLGVVWGAGEGGFDPARIRSVARVLDAAPMGGAMRTFLMRAADYTLTPVPAMLHMKSSNGCITFVSITAVMVRFENWRKLFF